VALHPERRHDARPVEDRDPGEIDAAVRAHRLLALQRRFARQIYAEQPKSGRGVEPRGPPAAGRASSTAITPFNFTRSPETCRPPCADGQRRHLEARAEQQAAAHLIMMLLEERVCRRRHQHAHGARGTGVRGRARRHPTSRHPLHRLDAVFHKLWREVGENIGGYRSYPRIVR
jgi:1-pyrroline-5-carboxylate dehydrogenase